MTDGEKTEIIYVELPDENVLVRRPVLVRNLGNDVYRIVEQPYDRDVERWAFEPGSDVVTEWVQSSGGRIRVAKSLAQGR